MIITEQWDKLLASQFQEPYVFGIQAILKRDWATLCPKPSDIWNAFRLTEPNQVRVVVLGQDPYINGEAHGLAFSSQLKITPSLTVIFKELNIEFGKKRTEPNLTDWAEQGVLLLNTSLTTVSKTTGAHKDIGWDKLTGFVLKQLAKQKVQPIVFMFWGNDAKAIGDKYVVPYIGSNHLVLKAIHPQAENYSKGDYTFTGCNHFRKANDFLGSHKRGRIKWL